MQLCVFCGSRLGLDQHPQVPALRATVERLGRHMAQLGISLVYGGGRVGLMGLLADAVLSNGGRVVGIIPDFMMSAEVAHHGLSDLQIVNSMHERKIAMLNQSDAFLALPGGFGTLDELFEAATLSQLNLLNGRTGICKPMMVFNQGDFFTPLLEQARTMEQWGFLQREHRESLEVLRDEGQMLRRMTELVSR